MTAHNSFPVPGKFTLALFNMLPYLVTEQHFEMAAGLFAQLYDILIRVLRDANTKGHKDHRCAFIDILPFSKPLPFDNFHFGNDLIHCNNLA